MWLVPVKVVLNVSRFKPELLWIQFVCWFETRLKFMQFGLRMMINLKLDAIKNFFKWEALDFCLVYHCQTVKSFNSIFQGLSSSIIFWISSSTSRIDIVHSFFFTFNYNLGAQLPRFLKVTPAVYPHLNYFTGKLNFCH